ncbi:MAG: sigma-70 family RNA polymerase sigma factor, partial [Deltaproteobacteria bacterium]|nr:sigma-70 family RNA polymerase sigma factor [Deltaproteobacteria bacterium]
MEHALVKYDNLALYLREIGKFKPLSREEEFELASRYYRKRDISALKRLIMSNLRFVVKIALEYRKYRVNISDVIQEGNIGILKAAWRFNPFKGVRFISYAVYWIRAQIHDYILRTWHIVKIGTTQLQRKLFYRLLSSQKRLLRRIGDETEIETAYLPTGATGDDALAMDMRMSSAAVSL